MKISLKTDARQIERDILNATRSKMNAILHTVSNKTRTDIINLCESLIENSEEYKSLDGGTLQAEFGIENPQPILREISDIIKRGVDVSIVPVSTIGSRMSGSINVVMLRDAIDQLISLPSGRYQGKEFEVPWLEWLLTQGDRIIVAGYHIKYDISSAERLAPKSGVAMMEKGGGWRVPPQFSGTYDSNWITRTFDLSKIKSKIDSIVEKNFTGSF